MSKSKLKRLRTVGLIAMLSFSHNQKIVMPTIDKVNDPNITIKVKRKKNAEMDRNRKN